MTAFGDEMLEAKGGEHRAKDESVEGRRIRPERRYARVSEGLHGGRSACGSQCPWSSFNGVKESREERSRGWGMHTEVFDVDCTLLSQSGRL